MSVCCPSMIIWFASVLTVRSPCALQDAQPQQPGSSDDVPTPPSSDPAAPASSGSVSAGAGAGAAGVPLTAGAALMSSGDVRQVSVETTLADLFLRDLSAVLYFDDTPQTEGGSSTATSVLKATAPAAPERGLRITL